MSSAGRVDPRVVSPTRVRRPTLPWPLTMRSKSPASSWMPGASKAAIKRPAFFHLIRKRCFSISNAGG